MLKGATIVFDLDGTLVDTAPDLTNALNDVLTRRGHAPVSVEIARSCVGHGAKVMIEEALRRMRAEEDVDRMLAEFLVHYEANIAAESRPYPGAEAALTWLTAEGARLAVCTNKREHLSRKLLEALELDSYFAAVAGRDTFPVSKPDPAHLLGAIERAGGSAARAVMIGDSAIDYATATAAAVPIVLVSFGYGLAPPEDLVPDCVIDRFAELEAYILRFVGARGPGRHAPGRLNPAADRSYPHPAALNEEP